jgi:hypothetical protein
MYYLDNAHRAPDLVRRRARKPGALGELAVFHDEGRLDRFNVLLGQRQADKGRDNLHQQIEALAKGIVGFLRVRA